MCVFICVSTDLSSEGMYPSLFLSALSSQSDRTLSLCWEQHCKLLPGVQGIQAKQVAAWSVDEVRKSHTHTFSMWSSRPFTAGSVSGLQVCAKSNRLRGTGAHL